VGINGSGAKVIVRITLRIMLVRLWMMRFILLIMFLMVCFIDLGWLSNSQLTSLLILVCFLGGIGHSFKGEILMFGRMGETVVFQARFATWHVPNLIIEVISTSSLEIQRGFIYILSNWSDSNIHQIQRLKLLLFSIPLF
jgi:hypothetical protein